MFRPSLLAAALLITSAVTLAQTPASQPQTTPAAAPTLTAEQQAQRQKQDAQMAQAALQVVQMIDRKQAGEVWDGASSVTRRVVTRADFVKQIDADRATLGAVGPRKMVAITRTQSTGGKIPAGRYINVSYSTKFANANQPVRELISFRFDDDHTWRVAGYSVR